jgi:hypothetical protein
MLTSLQKPPKLALPMLSAMLLLSLSGSPSPAQAPGPLASKLTPGRAVETITPAATVVSTAHYQVRLVLTCSSSSVTGPFCVGYFPAVAGRRRLNLTRMSCYMRSATYSTYATGKIVLHKADGSGSLVQYLPADHTTEWGHHVLNRAIEVQVAARQHISVALILASGGQALEGDCTAHGTLETLQ